jgi:hypothetical protein
MTVKIFTVSTDAEQINELETKLNQVLAKEEFKGYEIAASFPDADFSEVVLILQKP